MAVFRFIQCIFQGHTRTDITADHIAYHYCLRCGKVEPLVDLTKHDVPSEK